LVSYHSRAVSAGAVVPMWALPLKMPSSILLRFVAFRGCPELFVQMVLV
jgi:hypothetical protein